MGMTGIKVVHAMPGRVRVKISRLKNNPDLAREIQDCLSGVEGMQRVEVNLITGSVLLLYNAEEMDPLTSFYSLAGILAPLFPELHMSELQTWLDSSNDETNGQPSMAERLSTFLGAINQQVGKSTGTVDLKLLFPLTLFLLGVRGILAAEKLTFPAWYDLLWFAFGTFFMLNPQSVQARQ
jgi:Heavy metal associated domain 2